MAPNPAPAVPRYALYGEDVASGADEIIHCETIAARSRRYSWEIAPHSHVGLWQMLFLAEGTAEVTQGQGRIALAGPMVAVAPAGHVHGFRFSEGAEGLVLTMSRHFLDRFGPADPLERLLSTPLAAQLDAEGSARLGALGGPLLQSCGDPAEADQHLLQRALAESFLRVALVQMAHPSAALPDRRLRQFQQLVERHYREHWPLARYAAELGCTERTLTRLVRTAWSVSPQHFLHRRIVLEARRLLRFSDARCAEVADELGFADPSYFSRFYERMTGQRPSAERKR